MSTSSKGVATTRPQFCCFLKLEEHPQDLRVLYTGSETGQDVSYALRIAKQVLSHSFVARLWQHLPYFHDGTAATIDDGVTPYNNFRRLQLSVAAQRDLVQYLKSLVPRLVAKISWMKVTFAREQVAWELKNEIQEAARCRARDQVFSPGSVAALHEASPAAVCNYTWG